MSRCDCEKNRDDAVSAVFDALAERDVAVAALARVEELADDWEHTTGSLPSITAQRFAEELRTAIRGCGTDTCDGNGFIQCWNPGGPCPEPNAKDCELCGTCNECADRNSRDGGGSE